MRCIMQADNYCGVIIFVHETFEAKPFIRYIFVLSSFVVVTCFAVVTL